MELKSIAKNYAEAIINKDLDGLRKVFAEHVRLRWNREYIEGIFDVLERTRTNFQESDVTGGSVLNIYQDSENNNIIIIEFEFSNKTRMVNIVKFENEKIINSSSYILECGDTERWI